MLGWIASSPPGVWVQLASVIGIDMTTEMLDKAKRNAVAAGVSNIEFHLGEADELPVDDETVDVVITNGVFNLCLDKPKVLSELHRVLRPCGSLQMADILLHDDVTQEEVADKGHMVGLNSRCCEGAVAP